MRQGHCHCPEILQGLPLGQCAQGGTATTKMALHKSLLAEHGKFQMALPASEKRAPAHQGNPVMEWCHLLGTSQFGAPERT